MRIVVAEDDPPIRELVVHHVEREGYAAQPVADGAAALRAARACAAAMILDLGLPGLDGLDVVRVLRREGCTIPIVVLTARSAEVDRVVGLELGADDYVCKPFSPRELVARVGALLRRTGDARPRDGLRAFGRLEIDAGAREARVDGRRIDLKPQEFALLEALVRKAGIALSRQELLDQAWGYDWNGDERTVDVHVGRLRKALEYPFGLELIETLRGYGYKFRTG